MAIYSWSFIQNFNYWWITKLLNEGFKRSVYWNKYKEISNKTYNQNNYIRKLLDSSYQGVKRLFALAYDNKDANRVTEGSHQKHFLPRIKIESYKNETNGKIVMINQLMI